MSHMRPGFRLDGRRTAFILCLLGLFGYEGYALFVQQGGATSHLPPARDLHLTREVNQVSSLQQTFVMHADGLQAIDVFIRPSDQPSVGPLQVKLSMLFGSEIDQLSAGFSHWAPVATVAVDPATIDLTSSTRIPIPRIDASSGVIYQLDFTMPHAAPGHGLRFEAGGPTYVQGSMVIGGRPEWGDLKFRTEAQRATVFRNIQHMRASMPPIMQSDLFWLTALVAINWALATVIYSLGFAGGPVRVENGSVAGTADQPRV